MDINLSDGKFTTGLYVKSTNRYHDLHYTLSHPDPTKRLIVYSQVVRDNIGYVSRKMIFECICSKWNHGSLFEFTLYSFFKTILESLNLRNH